MKIVSYVNDILDLDMEDIYLTAKNARNNKVTFLTADELPGYDSFRHGVVVIWKGENYSRDDVKKALLDKFNKDWLGIGPG